MLGGDWRDVIARLDVHAFYTAQGVRGLTGGGPWKGLCPFHPDDHQSLSISTEGLFRCHACGAKGSAFDFMMQREGHSFPQAVSVVAAYAPGYLPPKVVSIRSSKAFDTEQIDRWEHDLSNNAEVMAYLVIQRGLTEETIRKWRLGWTGSRISIPMWAVDGTIVNAKLYKVGGTGKDKMVWATAGTPAVLFPPSLPKETPADIDLVLVEGEFDCLLMRQHGFTAFTGTAGAGTWKKEWSHVFTGRKVFVLFDRDEAGHKGALAVADALRKEGATVFIGAWPDGPADGYDCTDWFAGQGRTDEELRALLHGAAPYGVAEAEASVSDGDSSNEDFGRLPVPATFDDAPAVVARIDPSTKPTALLNLLRGWYPAMVRWSAAELRLFYENVLSVQFPNYQRSMLRTLMLDASEQRREYRRRMKMPPASGGPLAVRGESDEYIISDFKHMDLGQAWLNDTMYYTVTRGVILRDTLPDGQQVEKPAFQAVFISKEGLMPADTGELAKEKFYLNGVKPIVNFNESWESDPRKDYSWGWFLRNPDKQVDVLTLYQHIHEVFHRYLYLADPEMYDVLACYTMLTYVYRVFRSVGYLWFRALRGSGKSRTLDILQCLGFNAIRLIDPSDSFMFRRIAATSPLVLIDEAEYMNTEQKATLRTILNMGYQAGAGIGRSKVEEHEISEVQFDVFGPKVMASINDPDPTTGDRCIVYDMERSPHNLPDFNNDRLYTKWVALRNQLHCFGLSYAKGVGELADNLSVDDEGNPKSIWGAELAESLRNRDRQIWTPILTIAHLVDMYTDDAREAPLFHKVLDFAKVYVQRKANAIVEDTEFMAVMGLRRYVRDHQASDGWYAATDIIRFLRSVEGLSERFSSKRLSSMLTHKLKIVGPLDHAQRGAKRTMHYYIDLVRLENKCRSLMLPDEDMLSFREDAGEDAFEQKKLIAEES